eukprot:TRINITY_DN465_c0_g1_i1.p1 TRINITY_DN465_c0_g1~~TRINITY_DN465_c0_g1_i1.p1  ORF type:complete len:327 (+),score=53.90 TRINITY_DN465_c0_g1_i1:119-982(+)
MKTTILVLIVVVVMMSSMPQSTQAQQTWDYNRAKEFLLQSYAAYCSPQDLMSWECKWCKQLPYTKVVGTMYDNRTETFGFIGYNSDSRKITVSFRGTVFTDLQNWIANLDISKSADYPGVPNAKVHQGWYEAYQNLAPATRQYFQQALEACNGCEVRFTGHSLGASLMGVCVLDLIEQGLLNQPASVITFGQPRLGNQGLADYWNRMTYQFPVMQRVVNWKDLVPRLPPKDLPTGWWHFQTEVWHDQGNDQYVVCDGSGEDPNCSDSVFGDSVSDHLHYFGIYEDCS